MGIPMDPKVQNKIVPLTERELQNKIAPLPGGMPLNKNGACKNLNTLEQQMHSDDRCMLVRTKSKAEPQCAWQILAQPVHAPTEQRDPKII